MTVRKYRVSTVLYYLPIIYYLLIYLLYSTVPGVAIYTGWGHTICISNSTVLLDIHTYRGGLFHICMYTPDGPPYFTVSIYVCVYLYIHGKPSNPSNR